MISQFSITSRCTPQRMSVYIINLNLKRKKVYDKNWEMKHLLINDNRFIDFLSHLSIFDRFWHKNSSSFFLWKNVFNSITECSYYFYSLLSIFLLLFLKCGCDEVFVIKLMSDGLLSKWTWDGYENKIIINFKIILIMC